MCYFLLLFLYFGGPHGDSGDHILLHLQSYHRQYTVVTSSILTSFCNHFLCDAFVILVCICFCTFAYFDHINSPSFSDNLQHSNATPFNQSFPNQVCVLLCFFCICIFLAKILGCNFHPVLNSI